MQRLLRRPLQHSEATHSFDDVARDMADICIDLLLYYTPQGSAWRLLLPT